MRSIFQMGIPVSGKNMFPSNIAGLPTWFTIRASKHGYHRPEEGNRFPGRDESGDRQGRRDDARAGAAVVYDEPLKLNPLAQRPDLLPRAVRQAGGAGLPDAKLRKLVRNMIYDGVVAKLLDIDLAEMEKALCEAVRRRRPRPSS